MVPWITLATIPGPYKIPNLQLEFKAVYTNKVTAMVVRGAGRPQAAYVMEKVMDRIAREIDMDPAEVRRRNFIQKDEYPYAVGILYRDNNPLEYDSGNYPACLEKALEMIGYEDFRKSQLESRKQGVRLGVGIAAYVEGTGFAIPHLRRRRRSDRRQDLRLHGRGVAGAGTGDGARTDLRRLSRCRFQKCRCNHRR